MNKLFIIRFEKNITSFYFFNKVLKKLHEYFSEYKQQKLVFDLTDVDFIDLEVIPNILTVGCIIKDFFGEPVFLYIPWKPRLLSYLSDIRFISTVRINNIYELDENLLGDYDIEKINPANKIYFFEKGTTKEKICDKLYGSISVISEFYRGESLVKRYIANQIISEIAEICHNGCNHSESMCFAAIESNQSKQIATISISDYGVGYCKSVETKIKNNEWKLNLIERYDFDRLEGQEKNLYLILEAIYHRVDNKEYGLYNVVKEILQNRGTVRVHSDNIQLIFKNLESFNDKESIFNYLQYTSKKVENNQLDIKKSPIRVYNEKFDGVHIELQIPLS